MPRLFLRGDMDGEEEFGGEEEEGEDLERCVVS